MKYLITIIMCLFLYTGQAQEVKLKTTTVTLESLIKTATITNYHYQDTIPVYKSSKGSYFIVKRSRNGNYYKVYVTIE